MTNKNQYSYNYAGNTFFDQDVQFSAPSLAAAVRQVRKWLADAGQDCARIKDWQDGCVYLVDATRHDTPEVS